MKICGFKVKYHFTDRFTARRHAQSKATKNATKIECPIVTAFSKKLNRGYQIFEKLKLKMTAVVKTENISTFY